jgi:plasmid stability protein
MTHVQIRDVPEDVHRRLKSQAALTGRSLNEYLRDRMTEIARYPTLDELASRIREREPYTKSAAAALVRDDRDRR